MLLGILQWLVTIGRPDLRQLVSSLKCFDACPRKYHLELAIRVFGSLKTCPDEQIAINSRPMIFDRNEPNYSKLIPDFLKDYPEASEEMDPGFPPSFDQIMETTILVDSDHAQKTRIDCLHR